MFIEADWIWPGFGEPFPGQIRLQGERISELRARTVRSSGDGCMLIVPGFVNSHAHLDLTFEPETEHLEGEFTAWLLAQRDRREAAGPDGLREAVERGVERALVAGTTLVVDYDQGYSAEVLAETALRRVLLREVITFENDFESRRAELEEYLEGAEDSSHEIRGLAPHSLYATHAEVIQQLVELAREQHAPWSMHIAEQPDEETFLRDGTGKFAQFLADAGVDVSNFPRSNRGPVETLNEHRWLLRQPILVHANYLSGGDIRLLAGKRAAVVFCPRAHSWFGHSPYPLPELLEAGVEVALGTDALVSNGALSVLAEMRQVHYMFPEIPVVKVLQMGTTAGHSVIGNRLGSGKLNPGQPADFVRIEVDCPPGTHILEALLTRDALVTDVWIAGEPVVISEEDDEEEDDAGDADSIEAADTSEPDKAAEADGDEAEVTEEADAPTD